ncbi:MAG: hypothetical protein NTX37_00265 [Burkholderiales bacterium]|jgi:hypothetical protein|nr:hypothetical protein [Burkholderiales bacterium]
MTIAAAWIRTLENGAEELFFCSDSRLSSGKRFDHCQKTFRFNRTDAAICFAGRTDWAYPMIIATIKAADLHAPSQTRSLTLSKFKAHLLNLLNQMQREVHNFAQGENVPAVTFLFGGYDWWNKSFRLWRIEFDQKTFSFIANERTGSNALGGLGKIEIAGDPEWIEELRKKVKALAQLRYGLDMRQPLTARFNMEPFECIRDLLRNSSAGDSIGGAPQAVKVYQYLNSTDVGFFWPKLEGGRLFLSGRPLLDYERAEIRSIIDPDSMQSTWSSGNSEVAASQIRKAMRGEALECLNDEIEPTKESSEFPSSSQD